MALTEEECKAAVNDIEYDLCELEERKTGVDVCCLYNENLEIFRELVREYFQLKEKYNKLLDDVHDYRYETNRMKMTIRNLCKHFGVENEEELKNIYLSKPIQISKETMPIAKNSDDGKKLHKHISDILGVCSHAYQSLENGIQGAEFIKTMTSLTHYQIIDICKLVGIPQPDEDRFDRMHKHIQELSKEKDDILASLKENHPLGTLSQTMKDCVAMFRAYYETKGFHYASLEMSEYGIRADLSAEIEEPDENGHPCHHLADQTLIDKMPFEMLIQQGFEIVKEPGSTRLHLLDTDVNKKELIAIIETELPGSRITSFKTQFDAGYMLLRTELYVPYADMYELYKLISKEKEAEADDSETDRNVE